MPQYDSYLNEAPHLSGLEAVPTFPAARMLRGKIGLLFLEPVPLAALPFGRTPPNGIVNMSVGTTIGVLYTSLASFQYAKAEKRCSVMIASVLGTCGSIAFFADPHSRLQCVPQQGILCVPSGLHSSSCVPSFSKDGAGSQRSRTFLGRFSPIRTG